MLIITPPLNTFFYYFTGVSLTYAASQRRSLKNTSFTFDFFCKINFICHPNLMLSYITYQKYTLYPTSPIKSRNIRFKFFLSCMFFTPAMDESSKTFSDLKKFSSKTAAVVRGNIGCGIVQRLFFVFGACCTYHTPTDWHLPPFSETMTHFSTS